MHGHDGRRQLVFHRFQRGVFLATIRFAKSKGIAGRWTDAATGAEGGAGTIDGARGTDLREADEAPTVRSCTSRFSMGSLSVTTLTRDVGVCESGPCALLYGKERSGCGA